MDLSTVPPLVLVHILITLFSIPIVNNGPIQDLIRDQLIQLHNHPETTLAQFILNCRNQVAQPPPNNSWITRELVLNNEQINWDRLDIQQHRIISLRIIFQSPAARTTIPALIPTHRRYFNSEQSDTLNACSEILRDLSAQDAEASQIVEPYRESLNEIIQEYHIPRNRLLLCGILFTTVNTTEFARFYFKHAQSTNDLRWYLVDISNIAREIEVSNDHVMHVLHNDRNVFPTYLFYTHMTLLE